MGANSDLAAAKKNKNDEFYTQLTDIEKEIKHYREHFKGKAVYCNCDDPRASNFFKYFSQNFEFLGLKKVTASCYRSDDVETFSVHDSDQAVYFEYHGSKDGKPMPERKDIDVKHFQGDGDFRNEESINLLKEADIVVTNPPFSLFREYMAQLIEYDKQFLIIGDQNAITYKEIFALIKNNKVWLGHDNGGNKWFQVPLDYNIRTESRKKIEDGLQYFSKGSIVWFTNLDTPKRHEDLILYKEYSPEEYPTYDNYDAINVNKVADIPKDYDGAMGVPITFVYKYNPDQFEIIKFRKGDDERDLSINGKYPYFRIVIRRRKQI